jgi:hypothetical protein
MMIFDAHVHIGQWGYEWYAKGFPYLEKSAGTNVDKAIIMPTDQKNNAGILETAKPFPDNLYPFAWVDPHDSQIMSFLENNIDNISGLKFHSSLDKIELGITNILYKPYLGFANTHNLPILVHCGRWQETASYKFPLQIAEKYPDLKIICAHLGGDREDLKILAPKAVKERDLKNIWFDISATREWWTIGMAIDEIGADKIIFGSDYPVMHPKMSIESVNVLNLSVEDQKKVFYKNIMGILGI